MTEFTLVRPECGDWEALYMDGKLIAEGHYLSVMAVLNSISSVLPNTVIGIEILDEKAECGFSENLKDMLDVN